MEIVVHKVEFFGNDSREDDAFSSLCLRDGDEDQHPAEEEGPSQLQRKRESWMPTVCASEEDVDNSRAFHSSLSLMVLCDAGKLNFTDGILS